MILVEQFLKQQHKSALTQKMLSALKIEKRAKIAFEEFTGLEVVWNWFDCVYKSAFFSLQPWWDYLQW